MSVNAKLLDAFYDWFRFPGAFVLVDGQYGSTGKGLLAAAMSEALYDRVHVVVSNAGPNSGHTSYFDGIQIVLKQLPTFSVIASKICAYEPCITYLSAGAVINKRILMDEMDRHRMHRILIHPSAAVIDEESIEDDHRNVQAIASTGQGVGPALERKIRRLPHAVWVTNSGSWQPPPLRLDNSICFFEVSQGYSLGINGGFYPHTTSRECTVSQALADAGVPPSFHRKTVMTVRTYPIRVGNTQNTSGACYPDQQELTWEQLGIEPELTTVTKRVRRVFTWSNLQFEAALRANSPNVLLCNFMNYLKEREVGPFIDNIRKVYKRIMHQPMDVLLLGWGPHTNDIEVI